MQNEAINILKRVTLAFLVMFVFSFSIQADEPDLVLNTWAQSPLSKTDHTGYLDQIIIEAFKRIDLKIDIEHKPVERSIRGANNGQSDGEYIRVAGLSQIYPNLIQVPEKIFDFEFVVFTAKRKVIINGWDSLKPYSVGIVIGWKILEKNIQDVRHRTDFNGPEILFKMLDLGRIDIAVYAKFLGFGIVNNLGLKDIFVNTTPLAVKPMYLYLHKKHRNIIPDITKSLQSMKKDGSFLRIGKAYLLKQQNKNIVD
ncbi:MAG: transporter substrate-binding domain-containing protein [Pseudomonadales bacterium]|nr:transporter substrate-binding domain-containing protein [Pseudomonadales bacterium]NRA18588.1 transporter substrate-binding domain-containing protein [Oceanospirillaceae bacterium]